MFFAHEWSERHYDNRNPYYRPQPGRGGFDTRYNAAYRPHNSPYRPSPRGGGHPARCPGGRAPMYSPGFYTPQAPAHCFTHGGGRAAPPAGGGRRVRQPGGGLCPNPAQRQLGFSQDNFHAAIPPQTDPLIQATTHATYEDNYYGEDFPYGNQSQHISDTHYSFDHGFCQHEENYDVDESSTYPPKDTSSENYPAYDDSCYQDNQGLRILTIQPTFPCLARLSPVLPQHSSPSF